MKRGWLLALATIILAGGIVSTSYAEVKVGGELRVRGVTVDNKERNQTTDPGYSSGGFFEQRTRVNADASVNDTTRVFIQVQDSRQWGLETPMGATADPTIDTADNANGGIDLSQGYVDLTKLFGQPLSVRLGRQAMFYGDHRLIGHLEWSNNARRFDALKFMYEHEIFNADVWTAKLSETGGVWGDDANLNGIYVTLKNIPMNTVDVYLIQKLVDVSDLNINTFGARVNGGVKDFNVDYTAEFALQSGDYDANSAQKASAFAVKAGYTLPQIMGLRIGVEYDSATGNKATDTPDASDDDNKAFDNLYPTNHYLYGFTDDVGWKNMKAFSVNASLKPMDNLKVGVEYWKYNLAEENAAKKDDNGSEINIKANHELNKNVSCEAAYVMRKAGSDISTSAYPGKGGTYGTIPADESSTFAYFMINVKFN